MTSSEKGKDKHLSIEVPRAAFDPREIDPMYEAFVEVCADLQIPENNNQDREVIGSRIVDLVRAGVIDAGELRDCIIQEFRSAA
jgi:hypothetical protein